jgi:hypothetical protein
MTVIIGRRRAGSVLARDASCHSRIVSISMSTLIDHPNSMKKSRYDRLRRSQGRFRDWQFGTISAAGSSTPPKTSGNPHGQDGN